MKTQTSKQAFWLRSLILLPLLALLIYSFSEKKVVEKPQVHQMVNGEIKILIAKDKKVTIDNETFEFNSLSDKLIEMTKGETIKPLLNIEIQDHLDTLYLKEIKNELKKANLDISSIKATSIYLDDEVYLKINNHINSIRFTSDTIVIKDKNGGLYKGTSTSDDMYFTVPQIQSNSKNNITKALESKKSKETNNSVFYINKKGEVEAQNMQKATLEEKRQQVYDERKKANQQKSKTGNDIYIAINEKGIIIVNKFILHEINALKGVLNDLTKDLTKEEKEKIVVNLISYEAPEEVLTRVKSILRESVLLKINITKTQQKVKIEMPMSSQEQKDHKKVIDDYLKEHPEALRKVKSKSGETIEIVEIPMDSIPPPPTPAPLQLKNPSKELLEAKKKYDEKGNAYGEAMQVYFKEKKGNLDDLKKQYKEVMELYNTYKKLAEQENVLPPPPPPPPAKN